MATRISMRRRGRRSSGGRDDGAGGEERSMAAGSRRKGEGTALVDLDVLNCVLDLTSAVLILMI